MEIRLPQAEGRLVPAVERIAVLKGTALGDFVQCLPALEALRWAYPSAVITLLARPWHRELLSRRPSPVDEVVVVPEGAIGDESIGDRPLDRERFFAELRAVHFDLALQMHGGGRHSNPFVRRLGARVTAGTATPDADLLDRAIGYDVYQSEAVRNIEIAALVGAARAPLEPRLAVVEQDFEESRAVLPADERPLVVVHPGATDPRRRWPPERFAMVADKLTEAGARVVLTGVDSERPVIDAVRHSLRHAVDDLTGRLSLHGLVGLLGRASVLVTNDTGPRHLAAAVGAATVAVYWVGNVITAGPATRGRHRVAISWRVHCPSCGRDCMRDACDHRPSFVADVPVEAVADEALALFRAEVRRGSGALERLQHVGQEVVAVLDTDRQADQRA